MLHNPSYVYESDREMYTKGTQIDDIGVEFLIYEGRFPTECTD